MFGVDLTTLVKAHNTKLPIIVEECVKEVEKRGTIYISHVSALYFLTCMFNEQSFRIFVE